MPQQPERYRPPQRSAYEVVHEQPIELAYDVENDVLHTLYRQVCWYRRQVADFVAEQRVEEPDGNTFVVCRTDVSEGAVRRHTFDRSGELTGPPEVLVTIPPRDRSVLSAGMESFVGDHVDNLEDRYRAWRERSGLPTMAPLLVGDRLNAARALIRKLKEITAGREPGVPMAVLNQPTILALEDDEAYHVTERLHKHAPPYFLAVFYPQTGKLSLGSLESVPTPPGTQSVSQRTSIGMLLDSRGYI